jgi:hypothetical protein
MAESDEGSDRVAHGELPVDEERDEEDPAPNMP